MGGNVKTPASRIIAWQQRHGRHDMPWQGTRDAYHIWLSEVMLQQTQVSTVIPYYVAFLKRFPTVQALAQAQQDDVLARWSGLGYYSRARNLHKAAKVIVTEHGGRMPGDPVLVEALPGIGRSTAAAICVFAYGGRHAILDGNVKRVLARYHGIHGFTGGTAVLDQLWHHADAMLPRKNIEAYTQGLMDLGASVCARRDPDCARCPLKADCVAYRDGLSHVLPTPRPRTATPLRKTVMLILRHRNRILLEKRASSGIWGGMWSFPEIAESGAASAHCVKHYGVTIGAQAVLPTLSHAFTHFTLQIKPLLMTVQPSRQAAKVSNTQWFTKQAALDAAIPTPIRKLITSV